MDLLWTIRTPLARTHVTNATDTNFPSKVPTKTRPNGDGVIDFGADGGKSSNGLLLLPVGTGQNDAAMDMRVIGWKLIAGVSQGTTPTVDLWIPHLLAQFGLVFGNVTGVANTKVPATEFFMDTVTLTTGNANVSVETLSPGSDIISHILLNGLSSDLVEVTFDMGANATSGNCLYSKM